ncbi:DEAD/DEAH box helicase [Bacillus kwashiorkori]|uniref:DEAD/DEAH box helicase n=1 Tax=Bacillus kwashiorkori TaxID=1522318 RepID=UPI00078520C8|nr:DEAD/DEAH box helicase [Bacillus kwashiorkori]
MNESKFSKFQLKPYIMEAVKELNYYEPTEIQERVIPKALKGESIVGQSQTGTGKTHAYLLPILSEIQQERQVVQAVITAPTRELANQIYHEILKITKHCDPDKPIIARCYVGGTDKKRAMDKLTTQPHIVVGTPARIFDLVKENALLVHTSRTIVVDEADLMLEMGFIDDVDKLAARMPENLQMLVFSATIPNNLRPFLKKYMENPVFVHVDPNEKTAKNISHQLVPLRHRNKGKLLVEIMTAFNPYLAIIFTNTKKQAEDLADSLLEEGLKVGRLHGDLSPRERKKMMTAIRNLDYQYIVATDLASRGIDIEGVSHVIHYELPSDLNFYIHRAGRTGRANYTGISTVIYEEQDIPLIEKLEKMGITFANKDISNGEWRDIDDRNRRATRFDTKKNQSVNKQLMNKVKKPKKVKPGYKKKMQNELESLKKRQRRSSRLK